MKKLRLTVIAAVIASVLGSVCLTGCDGNNNELGPIDTFMSEVFNSSVKAESLNIIDLMDMTDAERLLMSTLQGLISTKTSNQIYVTNPRATFNSKWIDTLNYDYGVTASYYTDPWEIYAKYTDYVSEYILYEAHTPSVTVASSLSGVYGAVCVDVSIKDRAESELGLTMRESVVGQDESVYTEEYIAEKGFSKIVAFELSPYDSAIYSCARDFVTAAKGLCFWVGEGQERIDLLQKIDLVPGGYIFGYGDGTISGNEFTFMGQSNRAGYSYLAGNYSMNYSVLAAFDAIDSRLKQAAPKKMDEYAEDAHYVVFVMSDGDNTSWATNSFNMEERWWESESNARGKVPVSWGVSPMLYDLAPTAIEYIYSTATANDHFVSYGAGTMMDAAIMTEAGLEKTTYENEQYMQRLDMSVGIIVGFNTFIGGKDSVWQSYMKRGSMKGLIYSEWGNSSYHIWNGAVRWIGDKPMVACAASLDRSADSDALIARVNSRAKQTDVKNTKGYTVVFVTCWSTSVDDLVYCAENFDDNVKVINADQLMDLVYKYKVGKG